MGTKQGDLALLNDPVAQDMLASTNPARLAYVWTDGTPRVVPIWFYWTGDQIVVVSPPGAPKLAVLEQHPKVALTIDSITWPHKVLQIRGTATVQMVEGIAQEYAAAAERYLGEEAGRAWIQQLQGMVSQTGRVAIQPEWVGVIDFETRWPSAVEAALTQAGGAEP